MKTILRTVAVAWLAALPASAQTVPQAMHFQGRLLSGTNLFNGAAGLSFRIFNAPAAGTLLYEDSNSVAVVDGLYTALIGDNTTAGTLTNALAATTNAHLEIMVNGTALAPRERIVSVASALHANVARAVAPGAVTAGGVDAASFSNTFWKVDGNAGTSPAADFIGTSDNQPLEFRVNQARALRLEPAAQSPNVVGGHATNSAAGAAGATIAGGGESGGPHRVSANFGTVGGGSGNRAAGVYATVAGGAGNVANAGAAFIGGGYTNSTGALGLYATIAGGALNNANGVGSFVGGGSLNTATPAGAAIAGGQNNSIPALASQAAIVGGVQNAAESQYAFVGGGAFNHASGDSSVVAGGRTNVALGGYSAVGGGYGNAASSSYATVAGGFDCSAGGLYAFAAGNRAKASHHGSFVFGDSNTTYVVSTNANSWTVRCTGGARFISGVDGGGNPNAGVILGKGGTGWDSISDRDAKENFEPVDARAVLEKVARLPMTEWNMKAQDARVRHIGPMAQDFHAAFGLGGGDRHINSVDADGVALAAIQGLYEVVREQRAEIAALRRAMDELKHQAAAATADRPSSDASAPAGP